MSRRLTLVAVLAASTLTGCAAWDEVRGFLAGAATPPDDGAATVAAQVEDPVPAQGERTPVVPESALVGVEMAVSAFPAGAADLFAGSPIPVLAPGDLDVSAREAMLSSFQALGDGYTATIPEDAFDVVVNATKSFAVAPAAAGAPQRDMTLYDFSRSDEGGSLSFSRFGVDYALDFVCREMTGGEADCVDAAAAEAYADSLVLVSGGTP